MIPICRYLQTADGVRNTGGNPYQQTSFSSVNGTGTPVNRVQDAYNGYGQLVQQYQNDSGAVNTSTTPSIQYGYSQPSGANYSRLTSVTYPNGRVLNYVYNSGIDTTISRVSALADAAGTYAGTDQSYLYLGLDTIVQETDGNGVALSYIKQTGDTHYNSDGGDRYTGLDRFGRVDDQYWFPTSSPTSPTDRFQLGYDQSGNVLFKDNLVSGSNSELYHANAAGVGDDASAYDGLNRLTAFQRGTLCTSSYNYGVPDTITGATATNNWSLDALGNWNSTQGGAQTRTFNSKNQITGISGLTTPTYDSAGNMISDQNGYTLVYDAWNRLAQIKNGTTVIANYKYDANGDRVQETHGSATTDVYFDVSKQALEERQGSTVIDQYVWGAGHSNNLVLRDDNSAGGNIGLTGSGLGRRIYVQQDANGNVTALTDASGNALERFEYDPYGTQTVLSSSWGAATDAYGLAYGFQGGRFDSTTGLYHFGARDYSPTLGRWVQQDPAGYAGGANLYQADGSSPVDRVDLQGLSWMSIGFATPQDGRFAAVQQALDALEGQMLTLQGMLNLMADGCGADSIQVQQSLYHYELLAESSVGGVEGALSDYSAFRALADIAAEGMGGIVGGFSAVYGAEQVLGEGLGQYAPMTLGLVSAGLGAYEGFSQLGEGDTGGAIGSFAWGGLAGAAPFLEIPAVDVAVAAAGLIKAGTTFYVSSKQGECNAALCDKVFKDFTQAWINTENSQQELFHAIHQYLYPPTGL